jgi:molybdopterin/thiamine biosynthesis adenylyltransferase/rhodanese-related sulfurtransferase
MNTYNTRYSRHYSLPDFGFEGQQKLLCAKVLIIGAGGLGCPVLQYLAGAGIGCIGIADHDTVSLSNLQRQTLYGTKDIGHSKAFIASEKIKDLNPDVKVNIYDVELSNKNAWEIISTYDIVVDCTDNFASRYIINDVCFLLHKPLVFGAVYRYEGQVAVFNCTGENKMMINYRDLFPEPPQPGEVQDCSEAGVIGVLPGMIGLMQANEVIKLISGIGEVLNGQLLTFDMLTYDTYRIDLVKRPSAKLHMPADRGEFESFNYQSFCGRAGADVEELDSEEFLKRISDEDTVVVDVRETGELPEADFSHIQIPLSVLDEQMDKLDFNNIVIFCQSGKRSMKAAEKLNKHFKNSKKISHLKGGILSLHKE